MEKDDFNILLSVEVDNGWVIFRSPATGSFSSYVLGMFSGIQSGSMGNAVVYFGQGLAYIDGFIERRHIPKLHAVLAKAQDEGAHGREPRGVIYQILRSELVPGQTPGSTPPRSEDGAEPDSTPC